MPPKQTSVGDGFVRDVLPLIKDGFVILRSILDILIERIEEAERGQEVDVRHDIYSSIIDALEAEVESLEKEEPDTEASRAKIEVLESVISVLLKESDELYSRKQKKSRRPHKIKID